MADPGSPPPYTHSKYQSDYETVYTRPYVGPLNDRQRLLDGHSQPGYNSTLPQPGVTTCYSVHMQRDYTLTSIMMFLCCFWPTGAFAVYYARKARDAYLLGNIAEGQIYQEKARRFIIISLFVGIIIHAASITILLILLA